MKEKIAAFITKLKAMPKKQKVLLGVCGVVLLLLLVFLALLGGKVTQSTNPNDQANTDQNTVSTAEQKYTQSTTLAKKTEQILLYGISERDKVLLKSYNIATEEVKLLATLPFAIKKITFLSPTEILYIDQTNAFDNGRRIVRYNIATKQISAAIQADGGYFIDEYVISPNKQYLAVWHIQPGPAGILQNGKSRVKTYDLNALNSGNLLYDEPINETTPVHYPGMIIDTGSVYMDSFIANSGAGWAYGTTVSNFDGTEKKEIPELQNGLYGTKLIPSPKGNLIVFGGYDQSFGPGTILEKGFRQSVIRVNTLNLLNTTTNEVTKLSAFSSGDLHAGLAWDMNAENVSYFKASKNEKESGKYIYNIATNRAHKVPLAADDLLVLSLSQNAYLIGQTGEEASNLGPTYGYIFESLSLLTNKSEVEHLALKDDTIEIITIVPTAEFEAVLGAKASVLADTEANDTLQLNEYNPPVRPSLPQNREEQQIIPPTATPTMTPIPPPGSTATLTSSQPSPTPSRKLGWVVTCQKLAAVACKELYPGGSRLDEIAQTRCIPSYARELWKQGVCRMSPLYLYGKPGTKVSVKIHTPVFNTNPLYGDRYDVVLEKDGYMRIGGSSMRSIKFDYIEALRIFDRPTRGRFVKKDEVGDVLLRYAEKFKLTKKETEDLVAYGKSVVTSPYVFISFFDQETSKALLPMTFVPEPDAYINIVFYFKEYIIPMKSSAQEPIFPQLPTRKGFTAVEISGIVE